MKTTNLKGIDKAAILFSVLGENLSLSLFKSFSEDQLIKIRIRSKELEPIPSKVKKDVLEEYYFKLMSDKYRNEADTSENLFSFLENLTEEQLSYLLSNEKPRVIALALEQIDETKKLNILNKFDAEKKNRIILEIGNLGDIPLEAVVEVAKDIKKKTAFLPEPKEFSRGGGKSVALILNTMDEDEASLYLEQLSRENPELYAEVRKFYLTFEDLLSMPHEAMQALWSNPDIDVDKLAISLKSYDEETVSEIVEFLPKKKQAMFESLEKSVSKREVTKARKDIVGIARKMEKEGVFSIEDIMGNEEMVE
ncbi:MAG: hypothetical protein ISR90_06050 [Candidatus Marinimicrobia bacterium]|nr:hypothetical protein [Candidatus Neomarinimicrobiota bacterium]MBL7023595.1 hypothetical protein [Candidatus Neomarinimicrobiota bacterium]MBL7109525.1 hypothetical protein [Candidatus Neomarinimicrobiota bacterium]